MRHIRQATEADFDQINQIVSSAIRQCVTDSDEHHQSLCEEIRHDLKEWTENKDRSCCLVCQKDNSVLGAILVKEFWNLSVLFVDPARHRQGVGRELIAGAIDICKDRSPKGCIQLNSSNDATEFYKKMGFSQNGQAKDLPGGCVPFVYRFD